MFCYLHYGLAAILGFVGVKMVLEAANKHWLWFLEEGTNHPAHVINPVASLLIICGLLAISIFASLKWGPKPGEKTAESDADDSTDADSPETDVEATDE